MEVKHQKELMVAVDLLENPGFVAQLTDLMGTPIEWAIKKLPKKANDLISKAVNKSLRTALKAAVFTMNSKKSAPSPWWHRGAVMATGGAGGFFGLLALAVELPVSTTIMLRSIADTARSEGEDIEDIEAQLACMMVFALGSNKPGDDASESGYYAVRISLARALTEAIDFIAEKGIIEEGAPIIVKLIIRIAARFEIIVTEKAAAQAIPVIGAASGAAINVLFINHFQDMAKGHFVVRRLERIYGEKVVRDEYQKILKKIRLEE